MEIIFFVVAVFILVMPLTILINNFLWEYKPSFFGKHFILGMLISILIELVANLIWIKLIVFLAELGGF